MGRTSSFPQRVLIIGSGIGGLSTGIILAKHGCEVTVLEKNNYPGGLMRSYRRNGIDCSVGVHYLGSLDKGQILHSFFDYLGVTDVIPVSRMGNEGVIDRYIFDSPDTHPPSFDMPTGIDSYEDNLRRSFPEDEAAITPILASVRRAATQLHGLEFLRSGDSDFSLLDQTRPLGEILTDHQCSPGLRSVLAIPACWLGVPAEDCPVYYHNMALASYVSSSWRLECSGSNMAEAFAGRLRELGGRIITGAEVSKIEVKSRVIKGVQLSTKERLTADTVIGAIHPKVILGMLSPGDVKPSYYQRISGLTDSHGIFSVHALVEKNRHAELSYNIFKVDTDSHGNVPDLRYYQIRRCNSEKHNLLSILTSGKEYLWQPWQDTISGQRGRAYVDLKEKRATDLIAEANTLLGDLGNIEIVDIYTPLTMRDWVNSPGGSAYGVLRSASQIMATALLSRTAVRGLYLSGQSVLAPGMIGTIMGSFNTVKHILGVEEFRALVDI
ncbi:MAG: NAD(P)/FAD-dependent oxidoreductase [Desulfocapsaceae bacterium]|nr:NAD(P)/FAD-dependent oxidoreductase [Desulfocapsaceae bacterium]